MTWQSKTEEIDILSADALHVQTRVTVTFRPRADQLYELATEVGPDYYDEIIRPSFLTLARGEFAAHVHNALALDGTKIEETVLARLREAVAGKPLEIDRVSIDHIDFDRTVTAAIAAKVGAEQMIGQKDNELEIAKRDAEIARTAAAGRADANRIEAEGEAAAMVARGDAQATAQAAITNDHEVPLVQGVRQPVDALLLRPRRQERPAAAGRREVNQPEPSDPGNGRAAPRSPQVVLPETVSMDVVLPEQPVQALPHHAGAARRLRDAAMVATHEAEQVSMGRPETGEVDVLVVRQLRQR